MANLMIVQKKISELKAYENNPRNNDAAVDAVANSIKSFGFKVPVIIDKDNVIVCGHTRVKACEKLGIDEVDKRLKELRTRYDDLRERKEELANLKRENSAKSYRIKKFIANLEKSTDKLKDWNSELWMLTVESATVYRDKRIKFKFYDGIVTK